VPLPEKPPPIMQRVARASDFPTNYRRGLAEKICEKLMTGATLKSICGVGDRRYPTMMTVAKWLAHNAEFREQYYFARRVAAELHIDEIFEIADDTSKDYVERVINKKDGTSYVEVVVDNEAIQRSRVRIDARKFYAAKMVPKLYGDKVVQEHTANGDLAELLSRAINRDSGLPNR